MGCSNEASQNESMSIAHQTLQPDSQITDIIALRDSDERCSFLAFSQGTTMLLIDPNEPGYPVTESQHFHSPIIVIAPFGDSGLSVFILLRNYNFLIFRLPELVRFGSLSFPTSSPARSLLFHQDSLFSPLLAGRDPTSTATIRFVEGRVRYSTHPKFLALHVVSDAIHVLSVDSDLILRIPVHEPNIVDMAFIEPKSSCCRLVYLADWRSGRRLCFFTLNANGSAFVEEHPEIRELPKDAHSLLPLRKHSEGSLIVFTREGIIRVTARQGGPHTEDRISIFLPSDGIILCSCWLFDDVYLLCDSCGGLTAGFFGTEGCPRTEVLKRVGPTSKVVAIDADRFIVGSPFGDSVLCECQRLEQGLSIAEVKRIPGIAPIMSLSVNRSGILCATGRGDGGSLRLFGDSLTCTKIAEIPILNCEHFFAASIGGILYFCLCFWNQAQIISFNGSELANFSWSSDPVLYFAECDGAVLVVTDDRVRKVIAEDGAVLWEHVFLAQIAAAAHFGLNVAVSDIAGEIHLLRTTDGILIANCTVSQHPVFLSVCEDAIAVLSIENTLTRFNLPDLTPSCVTIPIRILATSLAFCCQDVVIGTCDGCLFRWTPDFVLTVERVGDRPLVFHSLPDGSVIGNADPAFHLAKTRFLLCPCNSAEVTKAGDWVCCLDPTGVSVFTVGKTIRGSSQFILSIPGLVRAVADFSNPSDTFCLIESSDLSQSIVKLGTSGVIATHAQRKARIGVFAVLNFEDKPVIVVGDDGPLLWLLSGQLKVLTSQKVFGTPTAACIFTDLLAVARRGGIEFFKFRKLDDGLWLERKAIADKLPGLRDMVVVNNFLIVADEQRSLTVFTAALQEIRKVSEDTIPKRLKRVAALGRWIFGASEDGSVYCWQLNDNGIIHEIGAFRCDSPIRAFCLVGKRLFYATAGGGIGDFREAIQPELVRLRDSLQQEQITLMPDREVIAPYPGTVSNVFIDLDAIRIIQKLPPALSKAILQRADVSEDELSRIIG
jgi:hypothetical protein